MRIANAPKTIVTIATIMQISRIADPAAAPARLVLTRCSSLAMERAAITPASTKMNPKSSSAKVTQPAGSVTYHPNRLIELGVDGPPSSRPLPTMNASRATTPAGIARLRFGVAFPSIRWIRSGPGSGS